MFRNSKALCLVTVVVFATFAVAVSSAPAAEFHSEQEHTFLRWEQTIQHTFGFKTGHLKCILGEFEGTMAASTVSSMSLVPTYKECQLAGLPATVKTNGCTYRFTLASKTEGEIHVECAGSNVIEVVSMFCTIKIGPQTLTKVAYANMGSGTTREIEFTPTIAGMSYTQIGKLCGGNGGSTLPKNFTDGTYTLGSTSMTGESTSGQHAGIWID